jgi:DNA-binding TFAR19-related protein (PDSD5 family)
MSNHSDYLADEYQEQLKIQQQIQELEQFVKPRLTKEALERYGNIRAAYPDKSVQLLVVLSQAIQREGIEQIDDAQLKELLKRMTPKKRDFTIKRK